jgi:adenosine deaminase
VGLSLIGAFLQLQVYKGEYFERMRELIAWDLCTTVNSDDPPFFGVEGGYVNENFEFWAKELNLSEQQIFQLCRNSVEASFLDHAAKFAMYKRLDTSFAEHTQSGL